MPVHAGAGGWKWGTSGKTYRTRAGAEQQAGAIYATGWRGDARTKAAAHRALSPSRRAETGYVLALARIMGHVHDGVMHVVEREHLAREDAPGVSLGLGDRLLQRIFAYVRPQVGVAFDEMAKQANKKSDEGTSLLGIRPRAVAGLESTISHARDRNIRLIEDAGRAYAQDVREVLGDPKHFGARPEVVRDLLLERGRVSRSRAMLIARDQTTKLHGALNRHRQVAAGVVAFRWSTSHDERVRASHRELDGQVFRWDDPPEVDDETATPGEPVQCRCVALPVLEELEPDEIPPPHGGGRGEGGDDDEPPEEPPAGPEPEPEEPEPHIARTPATLVELGIALKTDAGARRAAEEAIARAGLRPFLERESLLHIGRTTKRNLNGEYAAWSFSGGVGDPERLPKSHIVLNTPDSFAKRHAHYAAEEAARGFPLSVGHPETFSMSSLATSPEEMRTRTMVHELGHHLHLNARKPLHPATKSAITKAYTERVQRKALVPGRWTVSNYAKADEKEWFAETHSAYVHAPDVLRAKDPEAFDLVRLVRKERGLQ